MKRKIILMMILPIYLIAINNEHIYNQAMNAYNKKDYQKAYKLFSNIYFMNLSDSKLNFKYAYSAYKVAEYEMALAGFERVEILEPSNLQNKVEKAKTYFMLKMYKDSELLFKELISNPLTSNSLRKDIRKYLSTINSNQDKSSTYSTVSLDVLYDSNINNGSINDFYTIGSTIFPTAPKLSDTGVQGTAQITNIYDFGESDGFSVKNNLSIYTKDYHSYNDYDIKYLTYMPSLIYNYNEYTLDLAVGINMMTFGHKDYLRALFINPKFKYEHTNALKSIASFKFKNKDFQQLSQRDLDSDYYELSYILQNIISPSSYIQSKISGIKQKKHGGNRVDVNFNDYRVKLIYGKQFTSKFGIQLGTEIGKRKYSDFSSVFNSKREDTNKSIHTNLNVNIMKNLLFKVKLKYNKTNSNQNIFTYQKYTAFAGIEKTF